MRLFTIATLLSAVLITQASETQTVAPLPTTKAPTTKADVGPWAAAIVNRAARLIPTPAYWDKKSTGDCPMHAKTFSLMCALQQAADDAGANQPEHSDCRFHATKDGQEGSCGILFDENPIFTLRRVPGIVTGFWRRDAKPSEVWAGKMSDLASPVMYEARQVVNVVTTKKYSARLVDYNNDPETTFADLQKFFRLVEDRVRTQGAADLDKSTDDIEIEIYTGGTGVARTYVGWFPISGFSVSNSAIRFQLDGKQEVPPNAVDREILQRAATIITSDAVWNRADDRKCPATATTWSIYCAVERAQLDVVGAFHHRRPAGELVREIVEARTKDRSYLHRMMDYNNDPATHLSDVRSLFVEAIARIK
ncbi:MAG TPA: hypothetical protein VGK48_17520 [Terriglobia bacterium]|jgi:hypothetical protein